MILKRFRWYRKMKGGYWIKYHYLGWQQVGKLDHDFRRSLYESESWVNND